MDEILNDDRCIICPLDLEIIENMIILKDIHDAIIVSTAKVHEQSEKKTVRIITKDKLTKEMKNVETVW